MNIATQVILSALVVILAGWCVYRERVITKLRAGRRTAYRNGLVHGAIKANRGWVLRRKADLLDAGRLSDVRPDSGAPARISQIRVHRSNRI